MVGGVVALIGLALVVAWMFTYGENGGFRRHAEFMAILALGLLCGMAILVIGMVMTAISAAESEAQRPALVEALRATPASANEDVYGKVADFNMRLATVKYWNNVPVVGWFITDRWDRIEAISIPAAK